MYDTIYSILARWARAGVPLQAPQQISLKPKVILADDGVETTSDMIMGVTDAPAMGQLPIRSLPLGRVLEGRKVMDMLLGHRGASLHWVQGNILLAKYYVSILIVFLNMSAYRRRRILTIF